MIIRKQFKFEASHIVRNAVSERCKYSIHGHSYKVEVFLQSDHIPEETGMVMDFIELKDTIGHFIDCFDHAIVLWEKDQEEYIQDMQKWSKRVVIMSDNPTAENMAILFHSMCRVMVGDRVTVKSVRVHETDTGYAESEFIDLEYHSPYCKFFC